MPLPLIFIGIAAATGLTGAGTTVKAGVDHTRARKLNQNSDERMSDAALRLDSLRQQCGSALERLGEEKLFVLNYSMQDFLNTFTKIKNVDFSDTEGLQELSRFHVDQAAFEEIGQLEHFAASLASGSLAGATGGALAAFGAYSAASTFAAASTGTAISSLSGAAASNATLAFFGGGSLATGGLGMAGGTVVLGGLVAGPALLVMGIIVGARAGKGLETAKAHAAQADVICQQLEAGAMQCVAIRRRAYLFHNLLARLDAYFLPLICAMERVVEQQGLDFSSYSLEGKKAIAMAASLAVSVKRVLDLPILTGEGGLTQESQETALQLTQALEQTEK